MNPDATKHWTYENNDMQRVRSCRRRRRHGGIRLLGVSSSAHAASDGCCYRSLAGINVPGFLLADEDGCGEQPSPWGSGVELAATGSQPGTRPLCDAVQVAGSARFTGRPKSQM